MWKVEGYRIEIKNCIAKRTERETARTSDADMNDSDNWKVKTQLFLSR